MAATYLLPDSIPLSTHTVIVAVLIALVRAQFFPVSSRLGSKSLNNDEGIILDFLEKLAQYKVDELQQVFRLVRFWQSMLFVQDLAEQVQARYLGR